MFDINKLDTQIMAGTVNKEVNIIPKITILKKDNKFYIANKLINIAIGHFRPIFPASHGKIEIDNDKISIIGYLNFGIILLGIAPIEILVLMYSLESSIGSIWMTFIFSTFIVLIMIILSISAEKDRYEGIMKYLIYMKDIIENGY